MLLGIEKLEIANKEFSKLKKKHKIITNGYENNMITSKISSDIEKIIEEYYLIDIFDFEKIKSRIIKNLKLISQKNNLYYYGFVDKLYYNQSFFYDLEKIISLFKQIYYPAYMNLNKNIK
jgi:hypothetical protein